MIGEQEGNESAEQIHMPNAKSLSATQDPDIQAKCYGTIDFGVRGALCYILRDTLMKGKWLMGSLARPVLGLINGKPLSPTPS